MIKNVDVLAIAGAQVEDAPQIARHQIQERRLALGAMGNAVGLAWRLEIRDWDATVNLQSPIANL